MTIRITCDGCGAAMKIKDELAGKKGKCPACDTAFLIPEVSEDEAGEEQDDAAEAPEESPADADAETADAASDDYEDEYEDDEDWDDDEEDEDDLVDMPMELTAAPVTTPPPPAAPESPPRDRKQASETKKATRMSSKPKKKSDDGEFDPTDVLFDDDDAGRDSGSRPTGRVGSLDEEDDEPDGDMLVDTGKDREAMAEMFKEFTPAGGRKKKEATVASTSVAAELLARRAEEKRGKSDEAPADEEEAGNTMDALRQIGEQYKIQIIGFLVVLIGAGWFSYSVFGPKGADLPDLVDVEGTVMQDGEPVAHAKLEFEPADLDTPGSGGFATTDEEGEYEVMYNADVYGLPPGKYNVRITENSGATMGAAKDVEVGPDGAPSMDFAF